MQLIMKKGFKVTDVSRQKKIGIAAENLKELKQKSCSKLEVKVDFSECKVYVAHDGTLVDDDEYLQTLPAQTLLVLVKPDESMKTEFSVLYDLIRSTDSEYINAGNKAKEFLTTNIKEKYKVLQKIVVTAKNDKTLMSKLTEDPDWFIGLDTSNKTKEEFMTKRSKDRMRGYYYKTKTALQHSDIYVNSKNGLGKTLIDDFLIKLRKLLEKNGYNGCYFNRNDAKRLCSKDGQFECKGLWNNKNCLYEGDHIINPYRSREERIIFQTWNFDHQIELSRSIIPKVLEAVETICKNMIKCSFCCKRVENGIIASEMYYFQLFTTKNLKLVHIVCHYKGKHLLESKTYLVCDKCLVKEK